MGTIEKRKPVGMWMRPTVKKAGMKLSKEMGKTFSVFVEELVAREVSKATDSKNRKAVDRRSRGGADASI